MYFNNLILLVSVHAAVRFTTVHGNFDELNGIASSKGWREAIRFLPGIIVEYQGGREIEIENLLSNDNIVTEENYTTKVPHFHMVLSAIYAQKLEHLLAIMIQFWTLCAHDYYCKSSFTVTIQNLNYSLNIMLNSLQYFNQYLEYLLLNQVHYVLDNLIDLLEKPNPTDDRISAALYGTYANVMEFYEQHFYPIPDYATDSSQISDFMTQVNTAIGKDIRMDKKIDILAFSVSKVNNSIILIYNSIFVPKKDQPPEDLF